MYRVGGSRQRGGGNNPSCGCDMQAGWPPASEFPRGGLQGGGGWNFNEFNLAVTKNGKTRHLKGKWNNESENENVNETILENMNMSVINNQTKLKNKNKNKKRNKTNKKKRTSAPNGYTNLSYEGKKYYKKNNSGEVFEIRENGNLGNSMGYYVSPRTGKPYVTPLPPPMETEALQEQENRLSQPITPAAKSQPNNLIQTELPPEPEIENYSENYDTEAPEGQSESRRSSLAQNGGKRRRSTKRKHHKRRVTRRRR